MDEVFFFVFFSPNGEEMKIDLLLKMGRLGSFVKMQRINEGQDSISIYDLLPLSLQSG